MQTFSYAVKMKIEFVVLNQLMAVAARGVQRENFAERRYHHGSRADGFSAGKVDSILSTPEGGALCILNAFRALFNPILVPQLRYLHERRLILDIE